MPKKSKAKDPFSAINRIILYSLAVIFLLYAAVSFIPGVYSVHDKGRAVLDKAAVSAYDDGVFGNICISSQGGYSLGYAFVLINGEKAGDLSEGSLLIRVYPGDIVSIDGSAYRRELVFDIDKVSSNIRGDVLPSQVITNGDKAMVGEVEFR